MNGSEVLLSLLEGNYNLVVYAMDPLGNLGYAEVNFSIDIPESSMMATKVTPSFLVLSVVLTAFLLALQKKRTR